MSGWSFQIGESTAPQWHYAFSRFAESIDDWRPAFSQIVADFKEGQNKQFQSEGGYGSGGWAGLSPAYARWKDEHKPGMPILVFSGLLRRAATNPQVVMTRDTLVITIDDSGSYKVFSKSRGQLITKRKPAVAGYHQEGGGHLPARKVVQLPQSQVVRWRKIFHSFLVSQHRAPFGGLRG